MAAAELDPIQEIDRVAAQARRVETPCGDGALVWRIWGAGPPVLLGHGGQGAWSHWIRNIEALAQRFTVIAVDLPGCGDSAEVPPETHTEIARVLAEGFKVLPGCCGPVDLVGFSFGGVVFAHLAARYPELVRRLVLVGTGGLGTPHGNIDVGRIAGLEGEERRARIRANLLGLMLHEPESVDELAMYLLVANGRRARHRPAELVVPDKLVTILDRVSVQIDAIWGEHDRPHPVPAVQEAVLRRFAPDLDFRVVAGAGHWAMYERPEAFNVALLAILEKSLRPRI